MRPLVAHCHLGLGILHTRTGEKEQAERHVDTAAVMYRDMDKPFWRQQAEAELSNLGQSIRGEPHQPIA